ncbi:hypothetical protein AHF37_01714 [Paragonimus kellicotti]|nr:hypothetical protein AHF37_01714 [Paragonimus kellicotti]
MCNTVVHTDVRAFIRFLSHEMEAHAICSFLRFCEPTEEEKQAPLCPFCEYVIDRIQGELISNSSVTQITTVMQQVCIRVTHWNDVCRKVVQADAPALINYLVRHFDARHICERLQFCPGHQTLPGIDQLSVTTLESTSCIVCKPVVQALKHFLDRNSTKEEIALLLDLLCDLTVKYKQHCQQVVSEYLPQMIELLEKDADPELVCELLGLCSPIDNATEVLVTRAPTPGYLCPFCVYLLHRLRDENKNDLSFPNILHALVRLCPMTGPMMYDCQKVIKGNERIIAKRMELAENDSLICQVRLEFNLLFTIVELCRCVTVSHSWLQQTFSYRKILMTATACFGLVVNQIEQYVLGHFCTVVLNDGRSWFLFSPNSNSDYDHLCQMIVCNLSMYLSTPNFKKISDLWRTDICDEDKL